MPSCPMTSPAPLRVGLVGYGLAGSTFHAPHIAAAGGLELVGVVTGNAERAAQVRAQHPGAQVVPDVEALLAREDLDLVVVASPGDRHHEHARAVLEAGIACLVDKPFVIDVADGHELVALANERRVPLSVFQNRRYDDDYLLAREVVRSGRLGQVLRFESRIERWKPAQQKAWKAQSTVADGGGLLYDLGAHLVDQAVQLFGGPVESHAEIDRRTGATAADDDTVVCLTHAGGVRSRLVMSTCTAIPGPRMTVVGDAGALVIEVGDRQERELGAGARPGDAGYAQRRSDEMPQLVIADEAGVLHEQPVPAMTTGGYARFYAELEAYLRGQGPNPVDPAQSLAVIALIRSLHERYPLR